jgi:prolipoprotein diacylglyceryltransferase
MLLDIFHIDTVYAGVITDAPPISSILLHILSFVLSIVGVLGIIGIGVSGILYMASAGDEEQMKLAKKALTYSILGILIGAAAFVSPLIK